MTDNRARRGGIRRIVLAAVLSVARVLALPGVIWLWLGGSRVEALWLYAFILLSDVTDGWVARRLGVVTKLGAYLDVLADMIVILGLLATFAVRGAIPVWLPAFPALVAVAFLFDSRRSAPHYDPIGKYYGAVLYVLAGILLWGVAPLIRIAISGAIVASSAAVLVSRSISRRRGSAT